MFLEKGFPPDWSTHKKLIWQAALSGGSLPWATFTGNPLQFNAPKAHTLKSVKASFSPIQDLHGYANPWPPGGNVNKYNEATVTFGKWTASDGTVDDAQYGSISEEIQVAGRTGCIIKPYGVSPYSYSIVEYASDDSFIIRTHGSSPYGMSVTFNANTAYIKAQVACPTNEALTAEKLASYKMLLCFEATAPASYSPYSNECPISGWSEGTVNISDANMLNPQYFANSDSRYSVNADGTVNSLVTDGRSWGNVDPYPLPAGTYSFSAYGQAGYCQLRTSEDDYSSNKTAYNDNAVVFTLTKAAGIKIKMNLGTGAEFPRVIKPMLNLGSSASPYATYTGRTVNVTWQDEAGTVYGGYLLFYEDGSVDLVGTWEADDLGTLTWSKVGKSGVPIFKASIQNSKDGTGVAGLRETLCSSYKLADTGMELYNGTEDCVFIVNSNYLGSNGYVYIRDTAYDNVTASDFKTAMSGTTLVYAIATPVTYHLPSLEDAIRCFKGINIVWSDMNENVEVEAKATAVT